MGRLNKAIKSGFLLEAVFIEYAIMEDRLESVLRHSGRFKQEKHRSINSKLSSVKEIARNKKGLLRKYLTDELLESVSEWKEKRNKLIHALMKQNLNGAELKEIVDEGYLMVKTLNNKTTCYKRALEKEKK